MKPSNWLKKMKGRPETEVYAEFMKRFDEQETECTSIAQDAYKAGDMDTVREMAWMKDQIAKHRANTRKPVEGKIYEG